MSLRFSLKVYFDFKGAELEPLHLLACSAHAEGSSWELFWFSHVSSGTPSIRGTFHCLPGRVSELDQKCISWGANWRYAWDIRIAGQGLTRCVTIIYFLIWRMWDAAILTGNMPARPGACPFLCAWKTYVHLSLCISVPILKFVSNRFVANRVP